MPGKLKSLLKPQGPHRSEKSKRGKSEKSTRNARPRAPNSDLAKRKRAEALVLESEKRFRALIENSSDAITLLDAKGTAVYDSPAARGMLGYAPEDWIGRDVFALVHPDDLPKIRDRFQNLLKTPGARANVTFRVRHKSGSWLWIEAVATNLLAEPSVKAIVLNYRDITARKQAEESLHLQSAALNAAANSIMITNRDGTIEWINLAYTLLTGYTAEEAIGKNPRELVKSGKQDQAFYKKLWDTIIAGQVWHSELINRRKDGSLHTEEETITPLKNADGKISHFIAIKQDITERKRAEEALRESEERFSRLAQASFEGIAIHDESGILDANQPLADLFGYELSEMIGMSALDLAAPESRALVRNNILTDSEKPYEAIGLRKDGSTFAGELVVKSMQYQGRIVRVTALRDITERKRAEEAREHREAELQESQRIARIGSWEWTIATGVIAWSDGMDYILARDHGLPAPTFETLSQFYTPESWQRLGAVIARAVETGAPYDLEVEMVRADGTTCWTTTRGEAIHGANGTVVKLRGTVLDIAERKQAEEELKKSEDKFRTIFDNASDGMFIVNLEARKFFMCNATCAKMLGYAQDEFSNLDIADIHLGEDMPFIYEQIGKFSRGEEGIRSDIKFKRKNGSVFKSDLSPVLITIGEKKYLLIGFKDITERKHAEEEIKKQLVELQRWHNATLGRESRILDLKREVNELLGKAGQPPRYRSVDS